MVSIVEFLGIPGTVATCIIVLYFVIQLVGEILEFKGKVVPEFMKIRKFFKRKKEEKQEMKKALEDSKTTLSDVKTLLSDVNSHYSNDNIKKRNNWMNWVNGQADEYNKTLEDINDRLKKLDSVTEEIKLDQQRDRILDFAARVNNPQYDYSQEHFKKIFKTIAAYEQYIEDNNLTNGEVDAAVDKIEKAYEEKKNSGKLVW